METLYQGIIRDRLIGKEKTTAKYMTWELAHHAAERYAARIGWTGDRFAISVKHNAANPEEPTPCT